MSTSSRMPNLKTASPLRLDLTKPIPELQGVQMPAEIKRYYPGNWNLNGAFQFTNSSHRGAWNSGSGTLSPRDRVSRIV